MLVRVYMRVRECVCPRVFARSYEFNEKVDENE